jgi:RNA polymerase sigma factor (TIGR02999 family)
LGYNGIEMSQSGSAKHTITRMLQEWNDGKREAINDVMPLVYDELHRQAKRYLRRERQSHTLQTTALIHEAYLKLIGQQNVEWEGRTHFYAIAAQAMRRILVDYARTQKREKRGGDNIPLPIDEAMQIAGKDEKTVDLLALDEALVRLAARDERQARVVELRYFADMSLEETAAALGISRATAALDWSMAKAWLFRELKR